jgi:hypothetical protein
MKNETFFPSHHLYIWRGFSWSFGFHCGPHSLSNTWELVRNDILGPTQTY